MGKLILCSGKRTTRPYSFSSTGIRLYSIEELCYFLYHHVYMIDEEMFSDDLFEWIGSELKLPERAAKLKQLKQQNTDIKTIVTVILCSADYYLESEIKNMLKTLDHVIGMPLIKRNCIKANNCLKHKKYIEAAAEYEKIINSTDASELSPEEYGDIYHNLAVAKVHITGLGEASRLFQKAYECNHKDESLKQYLYTLRLCGNDTVYQDKLIEYEVSEELQSDILEYLEQQEEEAKFSESIHDIELLKKTKALGKMNEYYKIVDDIIDSWKSKARQM